MSPPLLYIGILFRQHLIRIPVQDAERPLRRHLVQYCIKTTVQKTVIQNRLVGRSFYNICKAKLWHLIFFHKKQISIRTHPETSISAHTDNYGYKHSIQRHGSLFELILQPFCHLSETYHQTQTTKHGKNCQRKSIIIMFRLPDKDTDAHSQPHKTNCKFLFPGDISFWTADVKKSTDSHQCRISTVFFVFQRVQRVGHCHPHLLPCGTVPPLCITKNIIPQVCLKPVSYRSI